MRDELRSTEALGPSERPKVVYLTHFLLVKFKNGTDDPQLQKSSIHDLISDWREIVNAPQGNQEEIAKAQRLLDEAIAAMKQAQNDAEASRLAEVEAKQREADAVQREAESEAAQGLFSTFISQFTSVLLSDFEVIKLKIK